MKYDRGLLLGFSFVLISVGSAIYVSAATLNYLRLYPALDQVEIQLNTVSFLPGTTSIPPKLTAQVTISNPTDYAGFSLGDAAVRIFFYVQDNSSITLFGEPNTLTGAQSAGGGVGPHSIASVAVPIQLSSQQADILSSFYNSHDGKVMVNVFLTVDVITFLDSVTGHIPFTRTQDVPLSLD